MDVTEAEARESHPHHHGHDVGERLYIHRHSTWHQLPAQPKIVATLLFAITVVATPITRWPSFIAFLLLLIGFALLAHLPLRTFFARALIEVPFVLFAVLMPFVGTGAHFMVGPVRIYEAGLLSGASILAKGTLGVLAAVLLSTTTTAREVLRGLAKLRMPELMVQMASFMMRYINVVTDELERMRLARASRGFEATGLQHWKVIANSAGALFIRSYERGERVYLAMLSRGYAGSLPNTDDVPTTARHWTTALALPAGALLIHLLGRIA